MSTVPRIRRALVVAAVSLCVAGVGTVPGPADASVHARGSRYVFTDLGVLGGLDSRARAVGSTGYVAGLADTSPESGSRGFHAFRWTPVRPGATVGTMTDLGAIPADGRSAANAVDARGVVVGESLGLEGGSTAFVYDHRIRALPGLGGESSGANDIDDHGRVVGYASVPDGGRHAVLWIIPTRGARGSGTIRTVDLGVPAGRFGSEAVAVNAKGQVAGGVVDADYYGYAAIWTPTRPHATTGTWKELGLLPGGTGTVARDINRYGVVVGQGDSSAGDRAFLYDGRMHVLAPLPGGSWSFAFGINDAGDVVGYADTGDGTGDRAVVWRHSRPIDLNGWLPASAKAAGYVLRAAYGINGRGQIVGVATVGDHAHAFLLTPARSAHGHR